MNTGNTFAACIAGRRNLACAETVHNLILMHFAELVFSNARDFDNPTHLLKHSALLTLDSTALFHPALRAWIKRVSSQEKIIHHTPLACFQAYPKLYKCLALRFIKYHASYAEKPYRLYCRFVFAHLAADLWECAVGFTKPAGVWINPLDSVVYYLFDYHGEGKFALLETTQLLQPQPPMKRYTNERDDDDDEEARGRFVLRCYRIEAEDHVNRVVAVFQRYRENVYFCKFSPAPDAPASEVYQLYPLDETKTVLDIPNNMMLAVYVVVGQDESKIELVAQTTRGDQPLHWTMNESVYAVMVVIARDVSEADRMITEGV